MADKPRFSRTLSPPFAAAQPARTKAGPTQMRLFAPAEPTLDLSFGRARRVQLDAFSWVEHVPQWLMRHEALLEDLLAQAQWEQRDRWMFTQRVREPRLTAEYPALAE